MKAKYCPECERNVTPRKKFNWLLFILGVGILYMPFYWMQSKKCPICSGTHFEPYRAKNG